MKPVKRDDARKTVGIWIRVSTEDQARGESPAVHEKRARLYAEAKGWEVVTVYDLAGVSGKAVMQHDETKRMLADMRAGRITGLIFSKLARLARNTKELLEFAEEFKKCDADLISLHESIDTSTPAGRLFYTMIAAMAQWEREEIAERVAASVPIRAKMGKPLGGKPPFGYHRVGDKVVPHPDEAPVRKLIYELYIEHRRKKSVARILNDRGYRTSNGSKFTNTTVNRLIADPTAKGILRVNYSKADPNRSGHVLKKPESEWVIHQIEPVVADEVWNRANAIREQAKKKPNARKPVHLFAGLVHCHCGQKMYVPSRNPRYVCWTCKNRIPVEDLEAIYHDQLKGFLFSEDQIARYRDDQDAAMQERQEKIALLGRERETVKREMDQVYRAYIDGQLTSQGLGSRYKPLEERLNQLDDTIPAEQAALDVLRIHALSGEQILQEVRDLHTRWPSLSKEDKRSIVEAITETIIISKNEVEIRLHYVPDTPPPFSSPDGPGSKSPQANSLGNKLSSSPGANFASHQALGTLETDASKGTQSFSCVPFVACRGLVLTAFKTPPITWKPETFGQHLLHRRLMLHLSQAAAAGQIGVLPCTLCEWEHNIHMPEYDCWPGVLRLLGYDPICSTPQTMPEKIAYIRRHLGLSNRELGRLIGACREKISAWSQGKVPNDQPRLRELNRLLSACLTKVTER